MNKKLTLLIILAPLMVNAEQVYQPYGEKYIIKPRHHDFVPGDGFMDSGSRQNPLEIETRSGQTVGTIKPRHFDFTPGDGFMDSGSTMNPYEIEIR